MILEREWWYSRHSKLKSLLSNNQLQPWLCMRKWLNHLLLKSQRLRQSRARHLWASLRLWKSPHLSLSPKTQRSQPLLVWICKIIKMILHWTWKMKMIMIMIMIMLVTGMRMPIHRRMWRRSQGETKPKQSKVNPKWVTTMTKMITGTWATRTCNFKIITIKRVIKRRKLPPSKTLNRRRNKPCQDS